MRPTALQLVVVLAFGLGCGTSDRPKEPDSVNQDGDLYPDGIDCNDDDPDVFPGATELCDGVDNNCDGRIDEDFAEDASVWFIDRDGDGFGSSGLQVRACTAPTDTDGTPYVNNSGDCDDLDPAVFPETTELCDGVDNNCDGEVDEETADDALTWWLDSDGDGVPQDSLRTSCEFVGVDYTFTEEGVEFEDSSVYSGPWIPAATGGDAGWAEGSDFDCNDNDDDIWPGNVEVCDGKDNDCDGDDDNLASDAAADEADSLNGEVWYLDSDADGFGDSETAVVACFQPDDDTSGAAYVMLEGDCDDQRDDVNPAALEVCDIIRDELFDIDGDGVGIDEDCDDIAEEEDAIGAVEWFTDADGDLAVLEGSGGMGCAAHRADSDRLQLVEPHNVGDLGVLVSAVALYDPAHGFDCEDAVFEINPSAVEVCDALDVDENCSGLGDEGTASDASTWYADVDIDGFGAGIASVACPDNGTESDPSRSGYSLSSDDCDDDDAAIHPDATEVCDEDDVDEDCSGAADEVDATGTSDWYADVDEDGFGAGIASVACPDNGTESDPSRLGYSLSSDDCDDDDAAIHPDATEVCDEDDVDEDCSGAADDDDSAVDSSTFLTFYADGDGDEFGVESATVTRCNLPSGYATVDGDCNDGDSDINPDAMEVCDLGNEVDENCDDLIDDGSAFGATAWYSDLDVDGYGAGAVSLGCAVDTSAASPERVGYSATKDDCDDDDVAIHPGAEELCDAIDNDCDGLTDDDDTVFTPDGVVYVDDDLDGFGREDSAAVDACGVPAGFSAVNTDCDDSDAVVYPGAPELCDAAEVDEDCDGLQNESGFTDLLGISPEGGDSYFYDTDGDGYGSDDSEVVACSASSASDEITAPYVLESGDCDEDSAYVNPGAADICNGVDDNCDGDIDDQGGVGLLLGAGEQGYDVTYCFDANQTYSDETATAVLTAVTVAGEDSQGAALGDELTCTALYDAANTDTVTFSWSSSSDDPKEVADVGTGNAQHTYNTTSDDEGTEVICTVTLTTNAAVPEEISGSARIYVSDTDELACADVMSPEGDTATTYTYSFCPSFKASPDTSADEPYYSERDWYGNLDVQSGTIVLAKPDFDSSSLKEDWDEATVTLNGEDSDPAVSVDSTAVDLTISNLTLSGTSSTTGLGGGGLFCSGSNNVTLLNAGFDGCSGDNGGAIYLSGCDLVIGADENDSTLIKSGAATEDGGGIYATSSATITMNGGEVSGNTAYYGGGIYADASSVDIFGGEVSGNFAYYGGGIYADASSVDIFGGEVSDNTAYYGGGIYAAASSVDISGGEVSGNFAVYNGGGVYATAYDGGGIYAAFSSVDISGGEISGNTTAYYGGGIYAAFSSVDISGGEISGNTAYYGGGIGLGDSDLIVEGDGSITDNTANYQGGGIYVFEDSTLTLSGGSITYNVAKNESALDYVGGGIHVKNTAAAFPTSLSTDVSSNSVTSNGATLACSNIFDGVSYPKVCIP